MIVRPRSWMGFAALAVTLAFAGCSGEGGEDSSQGDDDIVLGAAGASGHGATTGFVNCNATIGENDCVGQQYVGETIPLDIYIMFDLSGSMCLNSDDGNSCQAQDCSPGSSGCCNLAPDKQNPDYKRFAASSDTRLGAVRAAAKSFLQDRKSAGIGVGIGYFGNQCIGATSCDPAAYAEPAVPIAELPGNSQALVDSVTSVTPMGETPTGAALRGACQYIDGWSQSNPDHATVVLLVTDGIPEAPVSSANGGCRPTINDATEAASSCLQSNIKTYVLGVGPELDNLNQIAQAGGTKDAYLVENGNASDQILAALNAIRGDAAIPCELKIPPPPDGETLNTNRVNVVYTTSSCETRTILKVDSPDKCDTDVGGWYYDDPDAPKAVELCGRTCDDVSAPGGQLLFSVGCETQVDLR